MTESDDKARAEAAMAATAFAPSTGVGRAAGTGLRPSTGVVAATGAKSPSGTMASAGQSGSGAAGKPIGHVLKGRYKIKRLIGQGGMGGVYEGEHLEIGKRVAIKLVHALHAHDAHVAARIKQEARSTSAIESEHIVQVFDAGDDEELGLFLVMELLKGDDLGNLLARQKRLTPVAAAALVVQAAQGLARAHAAGIVHRDLKPANVFVCTRDDGTSLVKLVDFGIAKIVRDANRQATQQATGGLTRSGMVIGTPQYMSSEQAQGLTTVDHRTDVYSLGAVLFEAIVGTAPFQELPTYEQTILQIMTRPAPRLRDAVPGIHPELDRLCAEMLSKEPSERPADMGVVRARLLKIFPEIETSRMSFHSDIGMEATALAGLPAGAEVQARVDAALRASGSGPRPRAVGPGTQSALSIDPRTGGLQDVAGLPKSRGIAVVIAAGAAALVIAMVGTVAFVRGGNTSDTAPGSQGLVESATMAPAEKPSVTAPKAPVSAPPITSAPAVGSGPIASSTASVKTPLPAPPSTPRPAKGTKAPGALTSPAASTAQPAPAPRPVGGTGVANEF